jgi:predicted short-subunit dehydrogenase-like oxidoreductase (DUF2520 family)
MTLIVSSAEEVTERLRSHCVGEHKDRSMQHYEDNLKWIREAGKHQLVVGSQARILYSDAVVCSMSPRVSSCLLRSLRFLFASCHRVVWRSL